MGWQLGAFTAVRAWCALLMIIKGNVVQQKASLLGFDHLSTFCSSYFQLLPQHAVT